jgi:outer membrane protein TolC
VLQLAHMTSPKSRISFSAPRFGLLSIALLVAIGPGCMSTAEHETEADDEVYSIVSERRAELGAGSGFTINPSPDSLRQRILRGESVSEIGALTLVQCQRIAAENSRDYQARRESLYLAALDLTLERYQFGYRADLNGGMSVSGGDSGAESFNTDAGLTFRRVMGGGANVVLDIGADLFKSLASGDLQSLFGTIGLTITKPLLSGASEEAIFESLTRAERRVVDQARTYERFRRTFAVEMFSRYWRVLEEVEVVSNEVTNAANLKTLRERNEALGEAGRLTDIEVGQARQNELRADARVITARQRLDGLLDDLKFFMGLPVDIELGLDSTAFQTMNNKGIRPIEVLESDAVDLAMSSRFDMATSLDNVSDAERTLRIVEEDLGAQVDLTVAANNSNQLHSDGTTDNSSLDWNVGLDVNLPLDRMAERNRMRSARISLESAKRSAFENSDRIRLELRDDLRRLKASEDTFLIAESSVPLAEKRVESAALKLEAGRAETRDLLEAQEDLLQARNSRITALVDYQLANLDLFLDMEQLDVTENGVEPRDLDIIEWRTPEIESDQAGVLNVNAKNIAGADSSANAGEPAKEGR